MRAKLENINNMRQFFIFSERKPFGRDLANLLRADTELDALGWETDLEQAIRRIQKLNPPAVIVAVLDEMANCESAVARIQTEYPDLQITEINLATGVARIHGGESRIVQELRGLLSAIERLSDAEYTVPRTLTESFMDKGGKTQAEISQVESQ